MQLLKSSYSDVSWECTINHLPRLSIRSNYREHSCRPGKQPSLAFVVCGAFLIFLGDITVLTQSVETKKSFSEAKTL